jgi:hypothetical protein
VAVPQLPKKLGAPKTNGGSDMRKLTYSVVFFLITIVSARAETYRLIHAIGNAEHEAARSLSKSECEAQKKELKAIATALGTYNEQTGYGSITCLPEAFFTD